MEGLTFQTIANRKIMISYLPNKNARSSDMKLKKKKLKH